MGHRKTAVSRLIIGPIWLLLSVFILIPFIVFIGVLYGILEVAVLLSGRSVNAMPKTGRRIHRLGRSLWKWNWENIRWVVSGSAGGQGFNLTPGRR